MELELTRRCKDTLIMRINTNITSVLVTAHRDESIAGSFDLKGVGSDPGLNTIKIKALTAQ